MDQDEDLKQKLNSWQVATEIPPRFQADVWNRFAVHKAVEQNSFWSQFARLFFTQLSTPRYAVAVILMAALMGIGVARVEAKNTNSRH